MTRTQLLLTLLAEECNEVAQRASKAIRFGLDEVQEGQQLNNADRIVYELNDLLAIVHILQEGKSLPLNIADTGAIMIKKDKVDKWLEYSFNRGVYNPEKVLIIECDQSDQCTEQSPVMCGECWLNSGSPKCKCITK